jgi:hypothetical protein
MNEWNLINESMNESMNEKKENKNFCIAHISIPRMLTALNEWMNE